MSIIIQTLQCKKCQHCWIPRKPSVKLCPRCQTPNWDFNHPLGNLSDLSGQKFNMLTVISKIENNSKSKWLCKCDCGKERIVAGRLLKQGLVKDCGCLSKRKSFWPTIEHSIMFNAYKGRAKRMQIPFELSKNQFLSLILSSCYYCGSKKDIGVCRRESKQGYTTENSIASCHICSRGKQGMPEHEFLEYINNIRQNDIEKSKDVEQLLKK